MSLDELNKQVMSFLLVANDELATAMKYPAVANRQIDDAIKALNQAKMLLQQEEKAAA